MSSESIFIGWYIEDIQDFLESLPDWAKSICMERDDIAWVYGTENLEYIDGRWYKDSNCQCELDCLSYIVKSDFDYTGEPEASYLSVARLRQLYGG